MGTETTQLLVIVLCSSKSVISNCMYSKHLCSSRHKQAAIKSCCLASEQLKDNFQKRSNEPVANLFMNQWQRWQQEHRNTPEWQHGGCSNISAPSVSQARRLQWRPGCLPTVDGTVNLDLHEVGLWCGSARRLLLITALSPREKLIKAGGLWEGLDNKKNNNKDYLCRDSYGNNSYEVLRGASGRAKYPAAFISQQKWEFRSVVVFFVFFRSTPLSFPLPASVFSEEWSVGAGGGSVYVCVCRWRGCVGEGRG